MVRQQNPFEFPVTGAITWRLCGWFSKDAVSPQNHQPEPSKDICIEPVVNFMVRTLTLWMCCHCLEGEWLEKRNEKTGLRRFRTHSLCFCPQKDVAGGCSISLGSPVCGGLFRNTVTRAGSLTMELALMVSFSAQKYCYKLTCPPKP